MIFACASLKVRGDRGWLPPRRSLEGIRLDEGNIMVDGANNVKE
jgi:hypothetical protein